MVDLFMDFKMIYNMLQIFTLERSVLLRNVLTRFSQLLVLSYFLTITEHFPGPSFNVYY